MMTRLFFLISFLWMTVSWANELERVHIVSYVRYLIPSDQVPYEYNLLKENYNVEFFFYPYRNKEYDYVNNFPGDDPLLKKIIFFEYRLEPNMAKLPKSKMICFRWEAIKIQPHLYDYYDHVYTIDDDLIDNKKYFKFYYPVLQPMLSPIPSFNEKNYV